MTKVIAKLWLGTGIWEFSSPDDELGLEFVAAGSADLVDLSQELLGRYEAALELWRQVTNEIQEAVDASKSSTLMAEDQKVFAALREMDNQPEKTLRETVEGWKTAVPTKVLMYEETLKGLGYDELSEEERTINMNDAVEGMKRDK